MGAIDTNRWSPSSSEERLSPPSQRKLFGLDQSRLWRLLTAPGPKLVDPKERRDAQFLSEFLVVGLPIGLFATAMLPVLEPEMAEYAWVFWCLHVPFWAIYSLGRSQYYRWAVRIMNGLFFIGTTLVATLVTGQAHSPGFLLVPVLLAATLLSRAETTIMAILSWIAMIIVAVLMPEPDPHGLLHSTLLLLAGTTIIVAARYHSDRQIERGEQRIVEREAQHRVLLEAAYDGTALVKKGIVESASSGFASLFNCEVTEVEGQPISSLFHADAQKTLQTILLEQTSSTIQLRAVDINDTPLWVEIVAQRQTDAQGQDSILMAVRDLTEERDLQNQLLFADRMMSMGTLAAGVAHEINNPLTYILANQRSLSTEIPPLLQHLGSRKSEQLQRQLDLMGEGLDRVRQIVQDLATFSRIDDQQPGCVDVHLVADSAVNMAWNEIRHRARLTKDYDPIPPVELNDAKLGQVLLNLLLNAAQALPEGQAEQMQIRLSTNTDNDGYAVIQVEDTGHGIPPEIGKQIFEPFFTTKPIGQGTGLGLSVCHYIVAKAGGSLTHQSSSKGTCFTIRLPPALHLIQEIPLPAFDPIDEGNRSIRVLIVDDEPAIANLLSDILVDYSVECAPSGRKAIEQWEANPYDVMICDLMMPDVSGMDVYEFLSKRERQEEARVIFLTGGAFTPASQHFLAELRNEVIRKPFSRDEIRVAVSHITRPQTIANSASTPITREATNHAQSR